MAADTSGASGDTFFCAVEMQTDIAQEPFCMVIYRKNGRGHLRGYRFVRACAIEMHMDEVQQPL